MTPMQHTAIFHGCKNYSFQLDFLDLFHVFAQNIDCWYTVLTNANNLCFRGKNKKIMYTPVNPSFTI